MPAPTWNHELLVTIGGVKVDLSADVIGTTEVAFQSRSSEVEAPQPSTLKAELSNRSGAYTPDNPGSPHYPDLTLGAAVEYWVTSPAGLRKRRFLGRIDGLNPTFSDAQFDGTVTLTASDRLADAASQNLKSDVNERWNALAKGAGGVSDVWMFGEEDGATSFRNTGYAGKGLPAVRVLANSRRGQIARLDPDALTMEGAVTVTPDETGRGPVVLARHGRGMKTMMVWFRLEGDAPYLPEYDMLLSGRRGRAGGDDDGTLIWHLRYAESVPDSGVFQLELRDSNNVLCGVFDTKPADGAWHSMFIWQSRTDRLSFYYDDSAVVRGIDDHSLLDQEYIVAGGQMSPYNRGAQQRGVTSSFAGLMVSTATFGGLEDYQRNGFEHSTSRRWGDLMAWRTYGGGQAIVGDETRMVAIHSSMGRPQLDCISELAITVGGCIWHNPAADRVELLTGPEFRPTAAAAVIRLWEDDDISAGHEWGLTVADTPTRATATCPDGEAVYIDEAAEALGGIRDAGTIETCAVDVAAAKSVAAWQVGRIKRLSLSKFGVDLATAVSDSTLWPVFLALRPGARLRVTGLDPKIFGISSFDCHVISWVEEIGPTSARWTFTTLPADSPAESIVGDDYLGRVGWEAGVAKCSALTAGATSLTITAPGHQLTRAAGDYPLTIQIDGEQMTIQTPPAATFSPQTVTVARGARGTLPTAHKAGRDVFIAPDARVSP